MKFDALQIEPVTISGRCRLVAILSQLSYPVALLHAPIMLFYYYSRQSPLFYQPATMVRKINQSTHDCCRSSTGWLSPL